MSVLRIQCKTFVRKIHSPFYFVHHPANIREKYVFENQAQGRWLVFPIQIFDKSSFILNIFKKKKYKIQNT